MQIHEGAVFGDRYRLVSRIALGGMGEVWRATDLDDGELVAIKVLRDDLAGQSQFLKRLSIEADNARRMSHQNLAAVLDSGRDGQTGWLVMELVEGRPLTDYLEGGRTLTVTQLLPILYQCALALTAVHTANVVHRDIKPGNILVRPDGVVKLTDFGISRAESQMDLTAAGMVMGTAQYLPPEQAKGQPATPLGDLYSLGVIAYESLAGHRPFTGETQVDIAVAHVNQDVPPLPDHTPPLVKTLVMSLLHKNPANRPQDAATFARQVAYVAKQMSVALDAVPLPEPSPEPEHVEQPAASARVHPASAAQPASGGSAAVAEDEQRPLSRRRSVTAIAGGAVSGGAVIASVNMVPRPPAAGERPEPHVPAVAEPEPKPQSEPLPAKECENISETPNEPSLEPQVAPIERFVRTSSWEEDPGSFEEALGDAGTGESASEMEESKPSVRQPYLLIKDAPAWVLAVVLVALVALSLVIQILIVGMGSHDAAQQSEGATWLIRLLVV